MIIWPSPKNKPKKSFVPANTKRGRQIAAQNPVKSYKPMTLDEALDDYDERSQRGMKQEELMEKSNERNDSNG